MKLLAGVLLLLLHSTCLAEVVDDFTQSCPQFFPTLKINRNNIFVDMLSPPTRFNGSRYKQICQTRNDQMFFATFYDIQNRIPVYSSFRFNGHQSCDRSSSWFIEPQLDNVALGPNMASESAVTPRGDNQALNGDYEHPYDRGHLFPVYQTSTKGCADATFTLTNAAPQHYSRNRGQWKKHEKDMTHLLTNICKGMRAYVVTGVVPGNNVLRNRVRIPSHFWTAYCCTDQNNKPQHSGAYIQEKCDINVKRKSLQDIEQTLTKLYQNQLEHNNTDFTVFNKGCYTEESSRKRKHMESEET